MEVVYLVIRLLRFGGALYCRTVRRTDVRFDLALFGRGRGGGMLTVGVEGMAAKKEVRGTCRHLARDGIGETGGIVFAGKAESGIFAKKNCHVNSD